MNRDLKSSLRKERKLTESALFLGYLGTQTTGKLVGFYTKRSRGCLFLMIGFQKGDVA
jgi:hypothetical protein